MLASVSKVFHKIVTIQECQHCQLHFNYGIKNQSAKSKFEVILIHPLISYFMFSNMITLVGAKKEEN